MSELKKTVVTLTTEAPPEYMQLEPLGTVSAQGEWNLPYTEAVKDLHEKLAAESRKKWGEKVTHIYNVRLIRGAGHYGHGWYEGTGDAYGRKRARTRGGPNCSTERSGCSVK